MMRGVAWRLAPLALLPALLVCGCPEPREVDGAAVTLELWQAFKPEEAEVFRELIDGFEEQWSARNGREIDVVIHYVAYDDMITKLRTAAMARMTPDIAFVDSIKVIDLAFGRALTPLDPLEPFAQRYGSIAGAREQFVRASFDSGIVNRLGERHLYGLPVQTTTIALFWNRAMFRARAAALRQAGLDPTRPPRDWDELIRYGEVLTDAQRNVYGFGMSGSLWFNLPFFNMYGASVVEYDEDGVAHATLNSPHMAAALERIRSIAHSGVEGGAWKRSALFPDAGFINEKYAMIIMGPWMVENFTNAGIDFDIALIPGPTAGEVARLGLKPNPFGAGHPGQLAWSSSNVGGQTGVIMRTSQHPEVAFELLDYFVSEPVQRRWASGLGQIPVRLSAWPNLDTSKYPFLPRFMDQLAMARSGPRIPLYGRLESDIFNPEMDLLLSDPTYPVERMLEKMEAGLEARILSAVNRER